VFKGGVKKWLMAAMVAAVLMPFAYGGKDPEPRKVKWQVAPVYPELARQENVQGTVRLEVVIGSNGAVKSTKVLGGHPLLIRAAEEAVKKWRYEAGPESTTVVEFHFHPN
jgi:TonB family protein